MQYLPFCVWLISLSLMLSGFIPLQQVSELGSSLWPNTALLSERPTHFIIHLLMCTRAVPTCQLL